MNTDVRFLMIDAQYMLVRQWCRCKSMFKSYDMIMDKNNNPILINNEPKYVEHHTYSTEELIKRFFWGIGKYTRDMCTAEKIILLWDKAPYYKVDILGAYKDSREYHDESELDEIDIYTNPEEYANLQEWITDNNKKNEAKRFIVDNFNKLGMISIIHQGYEGDDLAYLCSQYLKDDDEISAIVSSDSDWEYWGSPNVKTIKFNGEQSFYEDKLAYNLERLRAPKNLDLFTLKAYFDTFYGSHNDIRPAMKNVDCYVGTQLDAIKNKDFSNLNKELYEANMKSFDIYHYPEIDEVLKDIDNKIRHYGSIGTTDTKCELLNSNGINVSNSYYETFIGNLNSKWYEGIN